MPDPDIYYNSKLTADAIHYDPLVKEPGLEPVLTSGPRLDPVEPAFNCFWGTPYLSKEGVWGCPSGDPSNPIYPPGAILQNGQPAPQPQPGPIPLPGPGPLPPGPPPITYIPPTDRQGPTKPTRPFDEVPEPTLPIRPTLTPSPTVPTWPFDADGNIFGLSPLVVIGIAVGGIFLMSSGKK